MEMTTIDFRPACTALARVVAGVRDDQLDGPTPCPAYSVADLLDHVAGLALAFTAAATGTGFPDASGGPAGDGSRLEEGWRERIADRLAVLAEAWRDPAAYDGLTMAGPVELPAGVAALVALDEVVVHAWDLARATGQEYDADPASVEACLAFATSFEPPTEASADAPTDGGLFGPPLPVPAEASALDRLAGATGRDPAWSPA